MFQYYIQNDFQRSKYALNPWASFTYAVIHMTLAKDALEAEGDQKQTKLSIK